MLNKFYINKTFTLLKSLADTSLFLSGYRPGNPGRPLSQVSPVQAAQYMKFCNRITLNSIPQSLPKSQISLERNQKMSLMTEKNDHQHQQWQEHWDDSKVKKQKAGGWLLHPVCNFQGSTLGGITEASTTKGYI